MPTTNPDDNKEARVGNVTSTHPFRQRDVEAGETIYGTHPARQASVASNDDYNAAQEYENVRNKVDPYGISTSYHNNLTKPIGNTVGLPAVNVNTFNLGSYTNPQETTDSSANDNSSSIDTYSFLDDAQRVADWKERNPHKNVFGLWKRDEKSLQARIDDATARGKDAKVARLNKKLKNFQDNQARRVNPSSDTYQKVNPDYDPNVAGSQKTIKTDKGGKFVNFFHYA